MTYTVESFGQSDIGCRRQINEDSFLLDDELGLYVVADGMGGQNAGEVASKMAVDVVTRFISRSRDSDGLTWPFGIDPELSVNGNRIRTAVMMANRRVWKEADSRPEFMGMGTTIVTVLAELGVLTFCSAGDSRAYRIRDRVIEQITTDDSWIQAAVLAGAPINDRLQQHPMRNLVTKAVGAKETIDLEIDERPFQNDDLYLLCSDGLHGVIPDTKILEIVLASEGNLEKAVTNLIAAANASGGKDNITAVLLRCISSGE
jgi:serine/threonine protein phosphatase PrpC